MYVPYYQNPWSAMSLIVGVNPGLDPRGIISGVREGVLSIDKVQPIYNVKTMDDLLDRSVAQRRFNMLLLGLFASMAIVLAIIGIYGVLSYSVSQRTHEIGVRMALGAKQGDIFKLVIGQGMMMALIGIAVGMGTAFAVTRIISSLLFGVSATDPLTFASIAVLLAAVAFMACYIPARRATKVSPMFALRSE